jgi:HKD family nuclease
MGRELDELENNPSMYSRQKPNVWLTTAEMCARIPDGLYDRLMTESLAKAIAALGDPSRQMVTPVIAEEAGERLVESVAKQLTALLDDVKGEGAQRAKRQLEIINSLLIHLRQQDEVGAQVLDSFSEPPQLLRAVFLAGTRPEVPDTGLSVPWLFTAGKGSPSLLTELRREIACCDRVDVLVSFITVSGVRKLFDILKNATATDASGKPRTHLRILPTTYTGATEVEALDYLARLPGCETKVSLDGRRTRLHAKAWIFHRQTGFGSAYVGSANLSGAALLGGLEWTVKFTEQGQMALFLAPKRTSRRSGTTASFNYTTPLM